MAEEGQRKDRGSRKMLVLQDARHAAARSKPMKKQANGGTGSTGSTKIKAQAASACRRKQQEDAGASSKRMTAQAARG